MVIRSREAVAKIKEESGGRLDITLYPSSVLGQDTPMMSPAIAGALEIYGMSMDRPRTGDAMCVNNDPALGQPVGAPIPTPPTGTDYRQLAGQIRDLYGELGCR
jgi:hypothetical protein